MASVAMDEIRKDGDLIKDRKENRRSSHQLRNQRKLETSKVLFLYRSRLPNCNFARRRASSGEQPWRIHSSVAISMWKLNSSSIPDANLPEPREKRIARNIRLKSHMMRHTIRLRGSGLLHRRIAASLRSLRSGNSGRVRSMCNTELAGCSPRFPDGLSPGHDAPIVVTPDKEIPVGSLERHGKPLESSGKSPSRVQRRTLKPEGPEGPVFLEENRLKTWAR